MSTYNYEIIEQEQVSVVMCKKADRLQLALHSLYTFTVYTTVTLVWCLVRVAQITLNKGPELSASPEVDIGEVFLYKRKGEMNIMSRLSNYSLVEIISKLSDDRLWLRGDVD
jgi:hypothetical protein